MSSENIEDKELKQYECGYCGFCFKQYVGSFGEGKEKVSSQVRCKNCGNFLKTWD